jgi:uncharacterized protein
VTQPESRILKGQITLPYQWALGPTYTRFFEEFRNRRIMGTRCAQCGRTLVPARAFCSRCFRDLTDWVEVKDQGTLQSWVLINFAYQGQPKEPPYIIGVVRLDGADNGFSHFVGGLSSYAIEDVRKAVRIGGRVRAVWNEKREGSIFDLAHFAPAG